jgi:hypothetical protein
MESSNGNQHPSPDYLKPARAMKWTVVLFSLLIPNVTCFSERDTKLTIKDGKPVRFVMTGSGTLGTLRVRGPLKQREVEGEERYIYWMIEFKEPGSDRKVESLEPIVYGQVPRGYVQVYPESDLPPPLLEDELYNVRVDTINANGVNLDFAIHKGVVVVDPPIRNHRVAFPD